MLDGAARLDELFGETARMGMPALAMTDHGNVFGAYDFYQQAKAAGVKPIIGMEAYLTPDTSRFERTRVRWADGGDDDVSGGGAFTHMTLLAETTARHAQPVPAVLAREPGGLLLQAARRPRTARAVRRRPDRHDRLPVRRDPDLAADRRLREGARQRGGVPRHLRRRQLLPRADGPRPGHREAGARRPAAAGSRPRPADDRHQRPALHPSPRDADAHEVLLCVQSGKTMADPKRFKLDGRRLLPQVAGGDALAVGGQVRAARGVRQHAADRRAVRGRRSPRAPTSCRASRCPRARTRTPGSSRRSSAVCWQPLPERQSRPTSASAPTTRSR